jgi:hypothetical protein
LHHTLCVKSPFICFRKKLSAKAFVFQILRVSENELEMELWLSILPPTHCELSCYWPFFQDSELRIQDIDNYICNQQSCRHLWWWRHVPAVCTDVGSHP